MRKNKVVAPNGTPKSDGDERIRPKMRISIDLDGTAYSHMEFFRGMMNGMQMLGYEVGILTAHRDIHTDADQAFLSSLGFPKPSFWFCRPYKSTETYAEFKAKTILHENIDLAFDDCNFQSAETEAAIRNILGDQQYRLIKVTPRFPENMRYE